MYLPPENRYLHLNIELLFFQEALDISSFTTSGNYQLFHILEGFHIHLEPFTGSGTIRVACFPPFVERIMTKDIIFRITPPTNITISSYSVQSAKSEQLAVHPVLSNNTNTGSVTVTVVVSSMSVPSTFTVITAVPTLTAVIYHSHLQ